jgi:hypothetical protein
MSHGFARLLAKSTATPNEPRRHERLDGHILDVLAAARTPLHATGHQLLGSFALPSRWLDVIEPAVARGALRSTASGTRRRTITSGATPSGSDGAII